ncbi:MAG: DUF115 domain-containing protein [Hyphomonadaceae bacterium]|nr:DUF115 domain-containing protein [Hyphomonadaceae bacterium]
MTGLEIKMTVNEDRRSTHDHALNSDITNQRLSIFKSGGENDWGRFLLSRITDDSATSSEKTIAVLTLVENFDRISRSWSPEDYELVAGAIDLAKSKASAEAKMISTLLPSETDVDSTLIDGKFVQRIEVTPCVGDSEQEVVEFGQLTLAPGCKYLITSEYDKVSESNDLIEICDLDSGIILNHTALEPGFNRFANTEIDLSEKSDTCRIGFRLINRSTTEPLYWYQSKSISLFPSDAQTSFIDAFAEILRQERTKATKPIFTPVTGEPLTLIDIDRLTSLQNKFSGERIFVMGNGPSLNKTPLEKLEGEFVFGLNRISLLFERVSWRPTFFTAFDVRVVPDNQEEFANLDIEYKFFSARYKKLLGEKPNHYWHHTKGFYDGFESCFEPTVPFTGFGGGGTIATMAIELAFFMGFREIYLIGTDVSYSVPKTVVQSGEDIFGDGVKLNLESTKDDDQNHFDPRYFGAGKKWHSPNVRDMKIGFARAASYIEQRGGKLLNATVGGELDQVQRVDFNSLF